MIRVGTFRPRLFDLDFSDFGLCDCCVCWILPRPRGLSWIVGSVASNKRFQTPASSVSWSSCSMMKVAGPGSVRSCCSSSEPGGGLGGRLEQEPLLDGGGTHNLPLTLVVIGLSPESPEKTRFSLLDQNQSDDQFDF